MIIDWFQAITFPRDTEVAFDLAIEKVEQYNMGEEVVGTVRGLVNIGVILRRIGDEEPCYVIMQDGTGDFHNPRVTRRRRINNKQ